MATIGTDGHVQGVEVLESIPLLDQAAIDAVRQWEYEPPTRSNGDPVVRSIRITLSFTLR